MDRKQHFFVQLVNRLPVEIPAGVINNPEPVKAKYIMYDYKNKAYIYEAGRTRHALPQSQHQKILQHNAKLVDMADPNAPVHLTHMADGSLDTVMNRLFNDLAAKAVSNKSYIVEFLPSAHRERIKLMKELTEKLRPDFEREQSRVEAIRSQLFEEFAAGQRQKDTIEDACRKEALRGFRALVAEKRVAMPPERGLSIIENAADVINRKFGAMYQSKADEFAKAGTARALYRKKVEPFHSVFKSLTAKHNGFLNITVALEELGPANRTAFDALLLDVNDRMAAPGGLRDTLEATYWGGVTQNLMDLNYGPEGIHADGSYIGREGLPRNSREFVEYSEQKRPRAGVRPRAGRKPPEQDVCQLRVPCVALPLAAVAEPVPRKRSDAENRAACQHGAGFAHAQTQGTPRGHRAGGGCGGPRWPVLNLLGPDDRKGASGRDAQS